MKPRVSSTHVIAAVLFIGACLLGARQQMERAPQVEIPRARFSDAAPLGGKGLRLLLERLGYEVKLETGVLQSMHADARVWILVDPQAGFTKREADDLLAWVKNGGTLIWATASTPARLFAGGLPSPSQWSENTGLSQLRNTLQIEDAGFSPSAFRQNDELMPELAPLQQSATSVYWNGVGKASGSGGGLKISRAFLEIAGSPVDCQIARVDIGKGRVLILPDALLVTNYALSKPDNAVLVTNIIRAHVASGTVYFDERSHGEDLESEVTPNLLYYLWRPPLRYALLQLLLAGILAWAFFGRRLGTPVSLPDGGPVTRASQFAAALGALFQKVNRPRAASVIIGEDFRRQLTRRLGLSISDSNELIAARAAAVTGYSARIIDRLLLQAKLNSDGPDDDEARALHDAQEMETILRSFDQR